MNESRRARYELSFLKGGDLSIVKGEGREDGYR